MNVLHEITQNLPQLVSQRIETTLNELAEFAVQIRTHHEHATQAAGKAIQHARSAGECLLQAKARIRRWCPRRSGCSRSNGRTYV